jgi:hypothetical protein
MQKLSDLLNHQNTRFRASDSDTIIQADRSACIARGADPPRTSATAAMVDSSIGYLGQALCSEATTTPSTCLEHLCGFGRKLQQQQAAAPLSTSPQCVLSPPSRSTRWRQQRCATWWRGSTPSGEPVGESGLLLFVGVERGHSQELQRRLPVSISSPPPVRGARTPAIPLLWPAVVDETGLRVDYQNSEGLIEKVTTTDVPTSRLANL